ncbi:MAG: gephyrin-like molybdotransferase Glp [Desulfosoma sp.]
MPEFLKVKTAEEVLSLIENFTPLEEEMVPLEEALGRVVSRNVSASCDVPHFRRAVMDGYAVRARDTFGASESLPALLTVVGEVFMGKPAERSLGPGEAMAVPTGGCIPVGADALVMVEYTQEVGDGTIEVTRPVAPGDNILETGDDIAQGRLLFQPGWQLRAQDVGVLAAVGVRSVPVFRVPRVAVLSTGDEIVSPDSLSVPVGKIRDINTFVLAAQVREAGGLPGWMQVVPDDLDLLASACRKALDNHDMVLLSGGSSVGVRDYTVQVLEKLEGSELLVHGVAIRPGKPTILARIGSRILWGLPGQPASAMIVFTAFVRPSLLRLQGLKVDRSSKTQTCQAVLRRNMPSVHGRADYIRVQLWEEKGQMWAEPVFGSSAMISTLTRADGYVIVPEHVEGLEVGTVVTVHLFGSIGRRAISNNV